MIITLSPTELKRCYDFSMKCAENQQTIKFGQSDTDERSVQEIGRDNYIEKIAEVAFAKMMKDQFGTTIDLDFEYYPRGQWDSQDTVINKWKIDIKGTRQGGKWMLVEWNKINFRQRDKNLSHLFVMASVFWDRGTDKPTGKVDLVGCAPLLRLRTGAENNVTLKKGSQLPDTKTRVILQADNFGIRFEHLQRDWTKSIDYILHHSPPPLDDYPNPYTMKTYRDLFPEDYN